MRFYIPVRTVTVEDVAKEFVLDALVKHAVNHPEQPTVSLKMGPGRNQVNRIWLNVDGCKFIVEVQPWRSS